MNYYDVALICLNGHIVNRSMNDHPQHNSNFCKECGAATISKCKYCGTSIKGEYIVPGVVAFDEDFVAPAYVTIAVNHIHGQKKNLTL